MPLIDVTYPEGALEPDARATMVEELTTKLLRAERAPDTEFFRNITWVYVHELPEHGINAAGRPVTEPVFRVDVTTPQGALSDRRREEFVSEATKVVSDAAGLGEADGLRVWVLLHEVDEGSWGAAGQVIHFEQLREAAKAERDSEGSAAIEGVTLGVPESAVPSGG
jgi:phenylpyruvate tautomerase PptA (4-oxalocrotonate tautomerase family)